MRGVGVSVGGLAVPGQEVSGRGMAVCVQEGYGAFQLKFQCGCREMLVLWLVV